MKNVLHTLLFVFASLAIARAGFQATWYVSPTGSGTAFSPTQPGNLFAARDQVRTMTPTMTGDIVVYLYGGLYQLTNSFQLIENSTIHDSGTGDYNVIYQAVPGTTPIVSGGIVVTNWSLFNANSNIWRAYVGPGVNSRQLYVDGRRAIRARSALNPSGFKVTATGFTTTDTTMQTWGNPTNIELVARSTWKQLRCPVASITGTNIVMQNPGWGFVINPPVPGIPWAGGGAGYTGSPRLDSVTWVENAYELLSNPGMWYLNRATGYVYYIPRPDENLATATVVLPVVEKLVDASGGSLTTPIHNIVFSGITFEYATWLLPSTSAAYADNQTSVMWSGPTNALKTLGHISFQTAANILLTNNVFAHLGGSAVDFGGGAHHNVVIGNHIEDVSASGISLGEFWDYATRNTNQMTDGNVLADNYIRQIGLEYEDAVGILVGYARNTLVTHNDIANAPYTGISVGWGWGQSSYATNNQVNYNYVGDVMQTLYDGGSLYTLSAQTNSWVIGNYFKDSCLHGIYWDEGTAYYTALSNVVDNCGGAWVNIWTDTIHNNVATNNFSNTHSVNNSGTACVVTNTTYSAGQNWSPAAQAIIQNAGLAPAYTPIQLPAITFNDTASNCVYQGSWTYAADPLGADYNGDLHVSTGVGDQVDFAFYGTGVSALGRVGSTGGPVDVYLDGALVGTISTAAATLQSQATLFTTNNLAVQNHVLRLINSGGQTLAVDAFIVRGVPELILNDAAIVYDHVPSDWSYSSGRDMGDFGGDVHYSQSNGQYVQYTFVGPYISWITETENSEGNVDVYLDGVFQKTVNCRATTRIAQQRVFTATNLGPGRHALKLVKTSGSYLVVDAFAVTPMPPAPPAPLALSAVAGPAQATLCWSASPGATGYNVKRGTVTGGPYLNLFSTGVTNYLDNGLAAGTTYYYVVSATNYSGESANSAEAIAITPPAISAGIAPPPTGVSLRLTNQQANLSWTASVGATTYNVKRAVIAGGPYSVITNVAGTTAIDAGIASGTTYYYVVSSVNDHGESLNSAEISATTTAAGGTFYQTAILADKPIGYWPLDLSSDTNVDNYGNLLAADLSGHGNVGTYRNIFRAGNLASGPSIFLQNAVSFDGVTTYVDLSTGTNLALLNIVGKMSMEAWAQPASASTYGDLMGKGYDSALNNDEIEVRANGGSYHGGVYNGTINDQGVTGGTETTNWTHVVCTYDGSAWNLYLNGVKVASASSTRGAFAFADPWAIGSGTADGLSRCFQGNLCQAAIYTNALTSAQVSTHYSIGRLGQAPLTPAAFTAVAHDGSISLAWSPSVGATNYLLRRSVTPGGPYTLVSALSQSGYVDHGVVNGITYYYVVIAANASGNSATSAEINATPQPAPALLLNTIPSAAGSFAFSFTGQSNQDFVVETSTNLTDWVAVLTNASPDGKFTFPGPAPTNNAQFYRVKQ